MPLGNLCVYAVFFDHLIGYQRKTQHFPLILKVMQTRFFTYIAYKKYFIYTGICKHSVAECTVSILGIDQLAIVNAKIKPRISINTVYVSISTQFWPAHKQNMVPYQPILLSQKAWQDRHRSHNNPVIATIWISRKNHDRKVTGGKTSFDFPAKAAAVHVG